MFIRWRVLLCTLALISLINKGFAGSNHSYPTSGGLSGSDRHSYPNSGGLSGDSRGYPSSGNSYGYPSSGGTHGYPSPAGTYGYPTSGGGNGYPSPGGSHGYSPSGNNGYPSSGGSNGNPSSRGSNGYPSSGGSHGYPSSGGSNGYPSSGGSNGYPTSGGNHRYNSSGGSHGFNSSGIGQKYNTSGGSHGFNSSGVGRHGHSSSGDSHRYPGSKSVPGKIHKHPPKRPVGIPHTAYVYKDYQYTPPKMIKYIPAGGSPPILYPVSQSPPPTYVYQIKDSGSKYGTLLTGLALMNLGALANTTHDHGPNGLNYKTKPGEVCMFGVKKGNGDYEEAKIDCQLISNLANNPSVATTITNVLIINSTNGVPGTASPLTPALGNVIYAMLPNGTLVPLNTTHANTGVKLTASENNSNNTTTSSVTITTTTTNTTVTNALDVKGEPIEVTRGMKCFVIRTTPTSTMKKSVPCTLLQTYADASIKKNSAMRNEPAFALIIVFFSLYFVY